MLRLIQAIELATIAHKGQTRKYGDDPYILHPLRVLRKTMEFIDRTALFLKEQEDMLIVAVLHDVPEDTKVTIETIYEKFGNFVGDAVGWLTNPSKNEKFLPRAERKAMYRKHLAQAPYHVKVIKVIDRADNLQDFREFAPDFVLKTYIPETFQLKEAIGPVERELESELADAIGYASYYATNGYAPFK